MWLAFYLLGCCFVVPGYSRVSRDKPKQYNGPKRLVVVLDGVPYETIAELRDEGRFKSFRAPARLVSTFPSLTNPAMIEILGAESSPGYEDHYYDREHDKLVGGFQHRVSGGSFIRGTFREMFNYHAPALTGSFAYIAQPIGAILVAQSDVAQFRRKFRASDDPLFVAYIGATDSLAHLGGKGPLKSLLRSLDRTIEELRAESGGKLEVEMLSDHGNLYHKQRFVKLNDALSDAGFDIEKSLKSPRAVVLPRYGLVGSAALFTAPQNREEVARASAAAAGVDFAAYQPPSAERPTIQIVSARGEARLEQAGDRYKYEDLGGDPLELMAIGASMKATGKIDSDGFAGVEDWWSATRDHRYPDPLRRIFGGFTSNVRSTADVLVSFEDGYLIGSPFFSIFARMQATHGNLLRGESHGFAMSTRIDLEDSARCTDIRELFKLHEMPRSGHYFSKYGHCQEGLSLATMLAESKGT